MTIYDIAKKLNVSVATVSKVINHYPDVSVKTRKKIQDFLNEINFQPNSHAQTLSTKKSWMIGVVYYEDTGVGMRHPYFSAVIDAFKKSVESVGYSIHFGSKNSRLMNDNFLDYFRYRQVDGIVVMCTGTEDQKTTEMIESEIPTLIVDMQVDGATTVTSNNELGCQMAIEYLVQNGHTKIAHIAGSQNENWISNTREQGYIKAMKDQQLTIEDGYIQYGLDFAFESGYKAMKQLIALPNRPTAVFVASDLMAAAAIEAIVDSGMDVPNDISVIGFDDIELAQFLKPKLTTIRQNTEMIGQEAASLLVEQIEKKKKTKVKRIIPVEFIERQSCKKIEKK